MPSAYSSLSFAACLVLIVLGFNRGFDISDEGFYVLLADPRQSNDVGIINYDLFFKLYHQVTGRAFSLAELRRLRLILYLLGAMALSSFLRKMVHGSIPKVEAFLICSLGIFTGYAFLPPTLSYNSLTVVLSSFWLVMIFSDQHYWVKSILLGLILALLVYVKVTVAIVLFLLTIIHYLFVGKHSIWAYIGALSPFILLEVTFWILFHQNCISRLSEAIPIQTARETYSFFYLFKTLVLGFLYVVSVVLISFAFRFLRFYRPDWTWWMAGLVALVLAGISFFTHINEEWHHIILIFSAFLIAMTWKEKIPSYTEVLLFILPFILHVGSDVYWMRIGIHYWVFWLLLILIQTTNWGSSLRLLFCMIPILLVFNGIWWHPFGQEKPLWSSKIDFYRGGEVIKIDKSQVELVEKIQQFAQARGVTQIQAAYRVPGLIWLAGYQIPHTANVWDKSQLQIITPNPPKQMVYCENQSLPDGWGFDQSLLLGYLEGNPVYLLWN